MWSCEQPDERAFTGTRKHSGDHAGSPLHYLQELGERGMYIRRSNF
jgi:hypothetical protein